MAKWRRRIVTDREIAIELRGISKQYDSPGGADWAPRAVLAGVDLTVPRGEAICIMGPSGCGKSTLLNLIAALDTPTAGSVIVEGQELSKLGERELAVVRNTTIGIVFQSHHLLGQLTVMQNVLLPTLAQGRSAADAPARAAELLSRVGLADFANDSPATLSGGQRQRAAVARALVNSPAVLLADEPTGSLDRRSGDELADLLLELNASRALTLVVASHSRRLGERIGRIYELADGKLTPV
jgi:ABC-type lipoprotein export system ATPase subunit